MKTAEAKILESCVETYLVNRTEQRGGVALKLKWMGGIGFPDRTILLPGGKIAFAEVKRPIGGRKGPLQDYWRNLLRNLGFRCEYLKTLDQVDGYLCSL
jgi:hypothetical protein